MHRRLFILRDAWRYKFSAQLITVTNIYWGGGRRVILCRTTEDGSNTFLRNISTYNATRCHYLKEQVLNAHDVTTQEENKNTDTSIKICR
jgi:hypothetical protein